MRVPACKSVEVGWSWLILLLFASLAENWRYRNSIHMWANRIILFTNKHILTLIWFFIQNYTYCIIYLIHHRVKQYSYIHYHLYLTKSLLTADEGHIKQSRYIKRKLLMIEIFHSHMFFFYPTMIVNRILSKWRCHIYFPFASKTLIISYD